MSSFLIAVGILWWALSGFVFVDSMLSRQASDIQLILSGVFATAGAVAIAGGVVIARIDALHAALTPPRKPENHLNSVDV